MILNKYYLIETIKIFNGTIFNINYHNYRFNNSRKELFNIHKKINLLDFIIKYPKKGIFKCRILYNQKIHSIKYFKYIEKKITSFYFIKNDDINYSYKYENRYNINILKNTFEKKYKQNYEIIIIKNNYLTDTSISNLAFYDDNNKWITPKIPLLFGTTMIKLIENKKIIQKNISIEDIKKFTKIAMLNSMMGFREFNIKFVDKLKLEV